MDVLGARRLKGLKDENGTLKRLLADAMLDGIVAKDPPGPRPRGTAGPRIMAEA